MLPLVVRVLFFHLKVFIYLFAPQYHGFGVLKVAHQSEALKGTALRVLPPPPPQ